MTPLACFSSLVTVAMVTLFLPLTSGTPVEPTYPLDEMRPDHACLFICSLCFPDVEETEKLMACSNKVCGSLIEGKCAFEKFVWLGHHCGSNYEMVEMMWNPRKHKSMMKDEFNTL